MRWAAWGDLTRRGPSPGRDPRHCSGKASAETRPPAPKSPRQPPIGRPSPATREATRPREADFYGEDVRVRHEPAFIEPFGGETSGGAKYGLSGWTAPATPG